MKDRLVLIGPMIYKHLLCTSQLKIMMITERSYRNEGPPVSLPRLISFPRIKLEVVSLLVKCDPKEITETRHGVAGAMCVWQGRRRLRRSGNGGDGGGLWW